MHKGNMDRIRLWSWLKVKYENAAKFDTPKIIYRENIRLLNLKAGGSLVEKIDQFQYLEILWREI